VDLVANPDPAGTAPALLRITVLDRDKAKVGRAFSAAVVETGLASYPGFYALTPPGDASAFGVYWPTTVPAAAVTTRVVIDGQTVWAGPARVEPTGLTAPRAVDHGALRGRYDAPEGHFGRRPSDTRHVPLGSIAGARSGDKGGNANLGVWARSQAEFGWLDAYLTAERLAELVPAVAGLPVERHRLPNLLALNFVVKGLLGRGVAASTRLDPQAKALGEELRAAHADIPAELIDPRSRA
jgi:hypothetical protein